MTVNAVWCKLISDLLLSGDEVRPRDKTTKEILGYQTKIPMTRPLMTVAERKLGYKFATAEAAWLMSGDNRVSSIKPFAKHIVQFSDDGLTYFGSYGPKFVEQASYIIETLVKDPMSRQAVMTFWRERPGPTKDVPCTVAMQWIIRRGQLNCLVTMRSSDAWLGWVYDVANFSAMSMYIFVALRYRLRQLQAATDFDLGYLLLTAGSQHLYKQDWDQAKAVLDAGLTVPAFSYAPFNANEFDHPEELVAHYWALARGNPTPYAWLKELPHVVARTE